MKIGVPKVFISYTTRDGKVDEKFLLTLEIKVGKLCSLYIDLIHNDSLNKQDRVLTELANSDYMFLIRTDKTISSEWVNEEISYAKKLGIPIKEFEFNSLSSQEFLPIVDYINNSGLLLRAKYKYLRMLE